MSKINAYLFDIGNVILGFDFSIAVNKLRDFGITHESPLAHISEIKERYEAGEMSDDEFVTLAIEQLGFEGSSEDFIPIWQEIFAQNDAMITSIQRIADQGHPLYLLSNTNGLHMQHILRDFPIFKAFAGGIYSHEAKSMKPDLPMYQQAIDRFDLKPEETLYIDDLAANIETGVSLGFQTHRYDHEDHSAFVSLLTAAQV
ncbi:MAG: FMN phosphatase YigB (HAD superfamily) [Verrucomicrobiales bacterium]|jgi:FMN phosphatase YigB (HAD superfamily)